MGPRQKTTGQKATGQKATERNVVSIELMEGSVCTFFCELNLIRVKHSACQLEYSTADTSFTRDVNKAMNYKVKTNVNQC